MVGRLGRTLVLAGIFVSASLVAHVGVANAQRAQAQGSSVPSRSSDPESAAVARYRSAREAMVRGDNALAISLFSSTARRYPKSSYAPVALHYRAFLQYQQFKPGGSPTTLRAALETIKQLETNYPTAPQLNDARSLRTRICGELAKLGDEACREDVVVAVRKGNTELRSLERKTPDTQPTSPGKRPPAVYLRDNKGRVIVGPLPVPDTLCRNQFELDRYVTALNSLWKVDSLRAMQSTGQLLGAKSTCLSRVREQALLMLIQRPANSMTPMAPVVLEAARNDPDGNVRRLATVWLLSQEWEPQAARFLQALFGQSFRIKSPPQ